MKTIKEIEKAAVDYVQTLPFGEYFHDLDIERAFIAGAKSELERGEYDHIEDNLEMVGKSDHIGESTEKVDWDYWRRMYAGMALQGLVASDKWRRMEMGDRVCVCVEMADALIAELKKTK